ncbi:MAG: FeoA family protein [Deltaproteobacteria bacterium]
MTLDQLPTDRPATIRAIEGDRSPVVLRLMEMGMVRGASVSVRKRAPLGGPLELRVRDYVLSIRRSEAKRFVVEVAA